MDEPLIEIRPATATDADTLDRLVRELGYPVQANDVWSRIESMPGQLYRTLVAVKAGVTVGFGGVLILPVYEHPRPIGWILALCVLPEYRGGGIGAKLLRALEDCCEKQNVADIRLHSGLQRKKAHQFYEGLGYDKSGYRFKKKNLG